MHKSSRMYDNSVLAGKLAPCIVRSSTYPLISHFINDNLTMMTYRGHDRGSEVSVSHDNRQLAAGESANFRNCDHAAEVLGLMNRALALLDANGAPADIGAYLDHALHRLRDWIESAASDAPSANRDSLKIAGNGIEGAA